MSSRTVPVITTTSASAVAPCRDLRVVGRRNRLTSPGEVTMDLMVEGRLRRWGNNFRPCENRMYAPLEPLVHAFREIHLQDFFCNSDKDTWR
jgi:hypothetical protein